MTILALATRVLTNTWEHWDDGSVGLAEGLSADAQTLFDLNESDVKEIDRLLEAEEAVLNLVGDSLTLDRAVEIVVTHLASTGWFAN